MPPRKAPRFGEWFRAVYVSESHPQRDGMYVRTIRYDDPGSLGVCYELTDGEGVFWQWQAECVVPLNRGAPLMFEQSNVKEAAMSELVFEFEVGGKLVRPGQMMYVAPEYHAAAGVKGKVERYHGDSVVLRTDNGAVPTVPVSALSWEPHPTSVIIDALKQAGFSRPTARDVEVWQAAQRAVAGGPR